MRLSSLALFFTLVFSAPTLRSQVDPVIADPQIREHHTAPSPDEIKREHERVKAMNKDRAARIKRDTDQLLELATELKQYVDKTNENVLSVDVIRKAEAVEKLAKSIREKMKEDYRTPDTSIIP